jgi:hypothetical protein
MFNYYANKRLKRFREKSKYKIALLGNLRPIVYNILNGTYTTNRSNTENCLGQSVCKTRTATCPKFRVEKFGNAISRSVARTNHLICNLYNMYNFTIS